MYTCRQWRESGIRATRDHHTAHQARCSFVELTPRRIPGIVGQ